MISIKNLSNEYNGRTVLNKLSFDLPRFGVVGIEGPSGCGKSTLLHAICGLIDFSGRITIDGVDVTPNTKANDDYRLKNVGLIFQDFKLYENETVLNNVLLPLDSISNSSKERKINKCKDLLDLVGLKNKHSQVVSKLSGGEKQRVAIARAIVNDPKIVVADEPTGSLDENNSKQIIDILKFLSKRCLILIVSHDLELLKNNCDKILQMKDGKLINTMFLQKSESDRFIPIIKNRNEYKEARLDRKFVYDYSSHCLSQNKWRTLLSIFVSSIGLVGVGSSISLTSSLSNSIKQTYENMIDTPKVVISQQNKEESITGKFSASFYEACDIVTKMPQYLDGVGSVYYSNFNEFFPDVDEFRVYRGNSYITISDLTAKNINEYVWISDFHENIYPNPVDYLENDEIILGINMNGVEDICKHLQIAQSAQSLIDYVENNEFVLDLYLANNNWTYSDQFAFTVKGITIQKIPCIYHTNQLWNEDFFESVAGFPCSDTFNKIEAKPWTLKKVYYLHCYRELYSFLNTIYLSDLVDSKILELGNKQFFPTLFRTQKDIQNRILFFENHEKTIPYRYSKIIEENINYIHRPIFSNKASYTIYPDALLLGFARQAFFSSNINKLDETIDLKTTLNLENNEVLTLDSLVLEGGYYKQSTDGVRFEPIEETLRQNEIVVSSGLALKLFGSTNCVGSSLYFGYDISSNTRSKNFLTNELIVKGVIENDNYRIYQQNIWLISYFQINFSLSAFDLLCSSIFYELDDVDCFDETLAECKIVFPDFELTNPLKSIYSNIDSVCGKARLILSILSCISLVISFILLILSNYLHAVERRKDIALSRCLGLSSKEAVKFVKSHSLLVSLYSFLSSSIEIAAISIFISLFLGKELAIGFNFSINPLSLAATFIISFLAGILASNIASKEVKKLSPLDAIKK